jgi:hypothetical protein
MRKILTLIPCAVAAMLAAHPAAAQTALAAPTATVPTAAVMGTGTLSPLETLWHVRAALNVAALGCRDADESVTVASYNRLIHDQGVALAAANDAVSARYRAQAGADWEAVREHDMTRLYNFFAQPAGQARFCAAAKNVLSRIATIDGRDLPGFALATLPMLEEPFAGPTAPIAPAATIAANAVVSPAPGFPQD